MEQSFNQSLINISTEYSNLYTSQIRSAVTVDELFGKGSWSIRSFTARRIKRRFAASHLRMRPGWWSVCFRHTALVSMRDFCQRVKASALRENVKTGRRDYSFGSVPCRSLKKTAWHTIFHLKDLRIGLRRSLSSANTVTTLLPTFI